MSVSGGGVEEEDFACSSEEEIQRRGKDFSCFIKPYICTYSSPPLLDMQAILVTYFENPYFEYPFSVVI